MRTQRDDFIHKPKELQMTVETLHSDFSNLRAEFADLRDQVSHSMSQFENYADRQADAAASREAMLAYKDHLKFLKVSGSA